jgi:putative copper export protein
MAVIGYFLAVCIILAFLWVIGIHPQFDDPSKVWDEATKTMRWILGTYAILILIGFITVICVIATLLYKTYNC